MAPRQALAAHDGALNDIGTAMVAGFLGDNGPGIGAPYRRMPIGASAEIA
ncbi:hypothetical protein [Nocardia alni]|nr:hypothetical protein [Nocardia alni]